MSLFPFTMSRYPSYEWAFHTNIIFYSDYDVFLSPLSDFKKAVTEAGMDSKVVYLDRGDEYKFEVKKEEAKS